jgi:hypothetical protein
MGLSPVLGPKSKQNNPPFSAADFQQSRFVMQNMIPDQAAAFKGIAVGITGHDFNIFQPSLLHV